MEIALITLSITTISFMIAYISAVKKLRDINNHLAEMFIAYDKIKDTLDARYNFETSKTDQDIHKENFIKFLSDSRDWAFEYIENSQVVIKDIAKELKSIGREDLSNRLTLLLPEITDDRR
jgi:hypothetical protein